MKNESHNRDFYHCTVHLDNVKIPFFTNKCTFYWTYKMLKFTLKYLIFTPTSAVWKVSSHFEYLENQSCGLDVIWQPVTGDLTVHPWIHTHSRGASQSAVKRRQLSLCTLWLSHSQWPSEKITFIMTMCLFILQLSCRLFWLSIASHRSIRLPTAKIWLPATFGFYQS
jgi:hypothetical protein